jgi:hypothetical protein
MVALLTASTTFPLEIIWDLLKLSCSVFCLGYQEKGLFALLSHLLFAFKEFFHDFLEFFLESVRFLFEELMAFFSGYDFLLIKLKGPVIITFLTFD